jgi:20S proteasome alpha/beta subunit
MSDNIEIQLEQPKKRERKILTCVIGGSCSDGVVIIGDSKVTFEKQPPTYIRKFDIQFYPIVTAYAGSSILYNEFKTKAFEACQTQLPSLSGSQGPPAVSGAFYMLYSTSSNSIRFSQYETDIRNIITQINSTESAQVGNKFEVFIAAQLEDKRAKLVHYMYNGIPDDIENRYKSIGGGEQYSYGFCNHFISHKCR